MEDNKMFTEENEEPMLITLTDEETGEDTEFEVIADEEVGGTRYVALVSAKEENGEYIILSYHEDGDDYVFETVDDDEEFERVEDYFNDLLFGEVDYDETGDSGKK